MPRPRASAANPPTTAADYKFPEAARLNNPTAEAALSMSPEALADQPIPEGAKKRNGCATHASSGTEPRRPTTRRPMARYTSMTRYLPRSS